MSGPAPNPFASNTELLEGEAKETYLENLGIKPKKNNQTENGNEDELNKPSRSSFSTMRREGLRPNSSGMRRPIHELRTLRGEAKPK